jgi:transmembrane sensor
MLKSMTISEMAARWYLKKREHSLDLVERAEFEQWLAADPRHVKEYDSIANAMQMLRSPEFLSTMADDAEQQAFLAEAERRKSKQRRVGQLVVVCLLSILSMVFYREYQDWQTIPVMQMAAQNPVGQIAIKTLDDGSKVTLSAKSDMEVTYYRHQRHVLLKEGEAIFEVVKDPDRPFIVETDTAIVTVLGTRFAVNRLDNLVRVSVDHGTVKVEPKLDPTQKIPAESRIITNGQVLEVYPNHATILVNRPASDAFAFLTGRLVFDRADIAEIATTISRYRLKQVQAQGKEARNISADINIHNIEQFLRGLHNVAPVSTRETPEYTLITSQR